MISVRQMGFFHAFTAVLTASVPLMCMIAYLYWKSLKLDKYESRKKFWMYHLNNHKFDREKIDFTDNDVIIDEIEKFYRFLPYFLFTGAIFILFAPIIFLYIMRT